MLVLTTDGTWSRWCLNIEVILGLNLQVLYDTADVNLPHIGLYAIRDIREGEELTYDYKYKQLKGKGMTCRCQATNCRGRLY
mgnify:CR=1 FL=1|eukprot:7931102-Pyramimonas_sp.AAC.1